MLLASAFIAEEKLKWNRNMWKANKQEPGQMGFHMFLCVHVHTRDFSLPIPTNYIRFLVDLFPKKQFWKKHLHSEENASHLGILCIAKQRKREWKRGRISNSTDVWLCAVEGARLASEQLEFKPYLCLAGPSLRNSRWTSPGYGPAGGQTLLPLLRSAKQLD